MQDNPVATEDLMNMVSRIQSVQRTIEEIENQREKTPFGSIENIPKTPITSSDSSNTDSISENCLLKLNCERYVPPIQNHVLILQKLKIH